MPPGWDAMRKRVLREEPTCRVCGEPAVAVDHIAPRAEGGDESRANLRGICAACHRRKTAEDSRRGKARKAGGHFFPSRSSERHREPAEICTGSDKSLQVTTEGGEDARTTTETS
jgi:5-methylcytosine-specific restriction endonuclease McrA